LDRRVAHSYGGGKSKGERGDLRSAKGPGGATTRLLGEWPGEIAERGDRGVAQGKAPNCRKSATSGALKKKAGGGVRFGKGPIKRKKNRGRCRDTSKRGDRTSKFRIGYGPGMKSRVVELKCWGTWECFGSWTEEHMKG